jgi:hypothetical protein
MLQLLSALLLGGLGFLQRSSARHSVSALCSAPASSEAECRVYHVSFKQRLDDLAPAYYTGGLPVRVPAY